MSRHAVTPRLAWFGPRFGRGLSTAWLVGGYAFLYLPIIALVVYSFNDSPVPNDWAGFTLRWYAQLLQDNEMLGGLWLSLKIAFLSATGAVVLGTLAALALVRYRRFSGRSLFTGMVSAPLVMPDVIIGLSLLLMLVSIQRALGWPERGLRDDPARPPAAGNGLRHRGGAVAPG